MEAYSFLFICCAFFTASFLKGLTGLGFSTICVAILAVFIDLKLAVPLVFIPSLSSDILVMIDAGRFVELVVAIKIDAQPMC